ncbi:unnamed protein product [Aureobasidium uvarum]|uniref:Ankyrin n=1 Tax=Aureobasidium uvarum TaxID=2773716 RepID=A0A9N8KHD9_9PEZI|nr:unnamed protein product [Aureobasidium uvarum]
MMYVTPRVFLVINDSTENSEVLQSLLKDLSWVQNLSLLITSSHPLTISSNEQVTVDIDALYLVDHRRRSLSRAMNSRIAEIERNNPNDDQRQSQLIDEAFERIMNHTTKDSGYEDLAMAAYDVVRHAIRQLKEYEFMIAVRHVLRCRRPHPITYPTITDVREATGGLLVVQQTSVVSVFHPSLSGYFQREHPRWFPAGHANMTLACLTVLMSEAVPTDTGGTGNWATGSLFGYAACTWGQHLRACSPSLTLEDMAMQYLEDEERFKIGTMTAFILQQEEMTYGFDISDGLAPVHVCSIFGLTNLLKRLPRTALSRVSFTGRTPLAYACEMGHVDTVDFLLCSDADAVEYFGAQFTATHEAKFTALQEAIKSRRLPIVETLLGSSVLKLTPRTLEGDGAISILLSLLQLESIDILRVAIARGDLRFGRCDHDGRSPLWWLLSKSYADRCPKFQLSATQLLLQQPDCDINAVDLGGRTYVMRFLSARIFSPELLRLLLDSGADVNRTDEKGESAIFHAMTLRYSLQMTSILVEYGADLDVKDQYGQGLLHRIVKGMDNIHDLRYLDFLIEHAPTLINSQDDRGRTPLHLALVLGKTNLAKELLKRAANVKTLDKFGRAPFDVACQYGRTAILALLAPVDVLKISLDIVPEQSDVISEARQSAPVRIHHPSRTSVSNVRGLRRIQSDQDLHVSQVEPVQPIGLRNRERIQQVTSPEKDSHDENTTMSAPGEVILETQLDTLPAWSLTFLGKCNGNILGRELIRHTGRFDKLLDKLQKNECPDPLEKCPDDGNTALHTIIKSITILPSHITALRARALEALLSKVRTNCSPQNEYLETPLHKAIALCKPEIAVMLIKAGAALDLRDNLDRTPLDLAQELDAVQIVTAIQEGLSGKVDAQAETHEAYEKIINQSILGTPHEAFAMAALEIVIYAMRPLTTTEFEHALTVLIQGRDPGPVPSVSVIEAVTNTKSLLTILQNCVVFTRDSVSAYFDKTRDRWFPSGQANLAFTCLRVLMFHDLPGDPDSDWASKSLYKYAACEWGRHLRAYSPKLYFVEDLALRYVADTKRLKVGNKIAFLEMAYGFEVYDSDFENGLGAVHVCSLLGLTNSIHRLMANLVDLKPVIDSRTHRQRTTPLMYAASMGHLDTVELLLELGADPHLTNSKGHTALYEALIHQSHKVVIHFLKSPTIRPDTIITENTRSTALMHLESFSSLESIRALLQRSDIDINECDQHSQTMLSHLLTDSAGHTRELRIEVAKLILDKPDFEIAATDDTGRSYVQQLLESASYDEKSLQLLLDKNIDIEHRDYAGETAIFYAICHQPSTRAAHNLLEHGAKIETKNYSGDGVMHCVVKHYHESRTLLSMTTLLSLEWTLVDSQDKQGRTALHKALSLGEIELVWEILKHQPNVDILDDFGRNALEVACQYGCVAYDDHATSFEAAFGRSNELLSPLLSPLVGTSPTIGTRLPGWSLAYLGK